MRNGTISHTRRISIHAATLLGVALLLSSGCKKAKTDSADWDSNAKDIRPAQTVVSNEPVPPADVVSATRTSNKYPTLENSSLSNDPRARRFSKTIVYTAMDDATVEGIYNGTSAGYVSNINGSRYTPPMQPVAYAPVRPVTNSAVSYSAADPSWTASGSVAWRYLVIHHSASDLGSAAIFHRAHIARGWDGLGYHFVIGNGTASGDGEVEVGYRWRDQARGAHAGNNEYNEHGIGICLVGNLENTAATARQMASLRSLVSYLMGRYNISGQGIIGHRNVPGKSTDCPGRNFNLDAFRSSVNSGGGGSYVNNEPAPAPARVATASIPVRATGTTKKSTGTKFSGAGVP